MGREGQTLTETLEGTQKRTLFDVLNTSRKYELTISQAQKAGNSSCQCFEERKIDFLGVQRKVVVILRKTPANTKWPPQRETNFSRDLRNSDLPIYFRAHCLCSLLEHSELGYRVKNNPDWNYCVVN